jgi:hypothetical protein
MNKSRTVLIAVAISAFILFGCISGPSTEDIFATVVAGLDDTATPVPTDTPVIGGYEWLIILCCGLVLLAALAAFVVGLVAYFSKKKKKKNVDEGDD